MPHIQLTIQANEEEQEALIGMLYDHDPSGFEQGANELIAYFDVASFPKNEIESLLAAYRYQTQTLEDQNWNAVWESNFEPVTVGSFCAVRAHFHPPAVGVRHEILITPKMSFGTGHHATTWMMLQAMEDVDFTGKTVFDFGTGTGVLAILAEKLGAASITAIDVDDWSIENAAENFRNNGCRNIQLSRSSRVPAGPFDRVLANINRNVLLDSMELLAAAVRSGGEVLMSGLMPSDEVDIRAAAEAQSLRFVRGNERGNWIFLLFVKG